MASELAEWGQIKLCGISAHGRHGVYAAERATGQTFVADVTLELPLTASDDLARTVDYGQLASQIAALIAGEPVNLIETLAHRVADHCLAEPLVQAVTVTVHKPQAPIAVPFSDVSVTLRKVRP